MWVDRKLLDLVGQAMRISVSYLQEVAEGFSSQLDPVFPEQLLQQLGQASPVRLGAVLDQAPLCNQFVKLFPPVQLLCGEQDGKTLRQAPLQQLHQPGALP